MKKIIIIALSIFTSHFSIAQYVSTKKNVSFNDSQPGTMAAFKWSETNFDFGKIPQGKPVTHEFKFTNVGKSPLVLSEVVAGCGCTTPEYPKTPILPGKSGIIKVTYNAMSVSPFNKGVTVSANVEGGSTYLIIRGEVVEPNSTN